MLRKLYLQSDSLTGTLPAEWASDTAFWFLESLKLNSSGISGSLPAAWAAEFAFPNLSELSIARTQISGSLPAAWTQINAFPNLTRLSLPNNQLRGSLPSALALPFPVLQSLDVTNNSFSGSLPAVIGSQMLAALFDGSAFTGQLPADWDNPGLQVTLSCQRNRLTGPLPAIWGSNPQALPQLKYLLLYNNKLSGTFPVEWGTAGKPTGSCLSLLGLTSLSIELASRAGTVFCTSTACTAWFDKAFVCIRHMFLH